MQLLEVVELYSKHSAAFILAVVRSLTPNTPLYLEALGFRQRAKVGQKKLCLFRRDEWKGKRNYQIKRTSGLAP